MKTDIVTAFSFVRLSSKTYFNRKPSKKICTWGFIEKRLDGHSFSDKSRWKD